MKRAKGKLVIPLEDQIFAVNEEVLTCIRSWKGKGGVLYFPDDGAREHLAALKAAVKTLKLGVKAEGAR